MATKRAEYQTHLPVGHRSAPDPVLRHVNRNRRRRNRQTLRRFILRWPFSGGHA